MSLYNKAGDVCEKYINGFVARTFLSGHVGVVPTDYGSYKICDCAHVTWTMDGKGGSLFTQSSRFGIIKVEAYTVQSYY